MVAAALIGGAASLIGGKLAQKGAKNQNIASAYQAQKQMDFQERMSSTAHQREVKDLRAAGLNPILSGTGGSGASSPSGSAAPMVDELAPALATAQQVQRMAADIGLINQQTRKVAAEADIIEPRATVMGVVEDALTGIPSSARAVEAKINQATPYSPNPLSNAVLTAIAKQFQNIKNPLRIDDRRQTRSE
nr:MAG: DNA pilot protein [Microvirus sp.]